jgi:signal transduction histidine kinase
VHTEDYPGTGVGLAVVKRVVEKLDGSVRAESSPGQGARFQVELPRPPARTAP